LKPITVRRARITLTATRTGQRFSGIRFSPNHHGPNS
jgi:hypothetical protein